MNTGNGYARNQLWQRGSGFLLLALVIAVTGCSTPSKETITTPPSQQVNLYTSRHYEQDDAIYAAFTAKTGIKVNIVKGEGPELIERLVREGEATVADAFLTADAGNLYRAKEAGVLQPFEQRTIEQEVPAMWRDAERYWVALTKRARVIVYAKGRVDPKEIKTYASLTEPKWKGRVLIRSSNNIYNQSLVASFIALGNRETTLAWAKGMVANMAREPKGGDRDQAKAIVAGEGDVAVMNTYYIGQMLQSSDPEEVKVAQQLGIIFPDQQTTGTHVNVSGIGVVKAAKNKAQAEQLIAYLVSKEAQAQFAATNYEYPIHPAIEPSALLRAWGSFKEQTVGVRVLGTNNAEATRIMNEAGWK